MAQFKMCYEANPPLNIEEVVNNISKTIPLAKQYKYCICDYKEEGPEKFSLTLGINTKTEEEAKEWFVMYTEKSLTTMRVCRTFPGVGPTNLFKVRYRCQHNTRASLTTGNKYTCKNTNCPAFVVLTVKSTNGRVRRKNRDHVIEYTTVVRIGFNHNHNIDCADALRYRDVHQDTKKKFTDLFEAGHSPFSAWESHKYDLQIEHGNNYAYVAGDRANLPDIQWCYRLYYKIYQAAYGGKGGYQLIAETDVSSDLDAGDKETAEVMEIDEVIQTFSNVFESLKERIVGKLKSEAAVLYHPAVKAFLKSTEMLTTDSSLVSALSTFGRYSQTQAQAKKNNKLAGLKRIGVQPISIARRKKMHVGAERQIRGAGQPKSRAP